MSERMRQIGIGVLVLIVAAAALWFATMQRQAHNASAPAQPPAGKTLADPSIPTFDIVRVDRRGTAVIAGRALPKAKVKILDGGKVIAEVAASDRGEWVATIEEPLPPGSQEITLEAANPDGSVKRSDQAVVVVVPPRDAPGDELPLVVLSEPGKGSRILQGPPGEVGAGDLTLDSVDYDDKGAVILSGKAKPGLTVRPYLDGTLLGEATADAEGRWRLVPKGTIKPGTYTLRVDELGADGKVVQRVELPFERAEPSSLQAGNVIVQPGNSLWRIARRTYGEGTAYAVIYRANEASIKDPDLIFPGQVLSLPKHTPG